MELPYQAAFPGNPSEMSLEEMVSYWADGMLKNVIAKACSSTEYIGVCLVHGAAQGYRFQDEIVQLRSGGFLVGNWSEVSKQVSETRTVNLDIDLRKELHHLRNEDIALQFVGNKNPDLKSGMSGPYTTMFIAVGSDGEWVHWERPLSGGKYRNNAVNRIFRAMIDPSIILI